MQMMPKISCPQRVASEAMGRASAAPDVVAISVPLAFMVTAGLARVAYNILRMGRLPSSRARSSQAGGRRLGRAGLPGDGLGEGKPRKNFVEIAAEMCRQGHPKGTNAPGKVALVSGAGPRQIVSSPDLVDRRGCRNDRMSAPAYRHRVRSRTPPRAAGSADTADARKPGRTIPYCCGRPRIGVRCRHWLPARTSPRRAPRNGDRRIFPPFRFSIPGPCRVSVRSEALPPPSAIMYYVYQTDKEGKGAGPKKGGLSSQVVPRVRRGPSPKGRARGPAPRARLLRTGSQGITSDHP